MSSGGLRDVMRPRGGFVLVGAGLEAPVQDADEPVRQLPQGGTVIETAVSLFVVVGAGTR